MKLNYQPNFWNFAQTCFLNQFDQIPTSLLNWKSSSEYQALFDRWGTSFRQRVTVQRAPLAWANETCRRYHYLKAGVSGYAHPMSFSIAVDQVLAGVVIVGTPFARRLKDVYGYAGLISSWEVLVLNRFWLLPQFQNRTVTDSKGRTHTQALASCAMAKLLKQIEQEWLLHHPPKFIDQPYRIRKLISYSDSKFHQGRIYKAVGFQHHASNCGKDKNLDRWIYTLPESPDPLPQLQATQLSLATAPKSYETTPKKLWRGYRVSSPTSAAAPSNQLSLVLSEP